MFKDHRFGALKSFDINNNKILPEKIIVYRDGVGDYPSWLEFDSFGYIKIGLKGGRGRGASRGRERREVYTRPAIYTRPPREEFISIREKLNLTQKIIDSEADARHIVNAIRAAKCSGLALEGNTHVVEAAKAIGKALQSQQSLERALWRNSFTGRSKDEIPKALNFLCGGLVLAKAHLIELDLSYNALGTIVMPTLAQFLKSPVCYSLKYLILKHTGLGIDGVKMLSQALMESLTFSKEAGTPLRFKTLSLGSNFIENDGAIALAGFLKAVGTLKELKVPQNSVGDAGLCALARALVRNPALQVLNVNDNNFTWRGSKAVAEALPNWQQLQVIDFGDCPIRTKGAEFIV